ncbi:MAG: LysE family transporter [Anaerolineae bacterium]|jgi:threonine/homoserine/homoserine lactone efflux protein
MSTIIRGIILGLSITAPIGPTNIEVIRRGTREGWRSAAMFCLGAFVALVVYLLLVTFGLSFLTESPIFNTLLTASGVLVLAFLSYSSLRDFFAGADIDPDERAGGNRHFIPGVVLTISNPAILLIWTGIMGADLASTGASVAQGFLLSLGILIGAAVFFALLTIVIHHGRKFLRQRYLRVVSLVAGVVLLFFCVRFAYNLVTRFL